MYVCMYVYIYIYILVSTYIIVCSPPTQEFRSGCWQPEPGCGVRKQKSYLSRCMIICIIIISGSSSSSVIHIQCMCTYISLSLYIYICVSPKKRLQTQEETPRNRAEIHIKSNDTCGIALLSWSLFLGLESLMGNYRGIIG